ncbi:MAG: cysteine--tRNA ligase [Rhodothermales bacterium]|nr:cysteine--tRNA ligase [Rhodothermales bacterium]MBO6780714.1 cysteine--tRNA ligase [Rhodothermales bacterium]
MPHPSIRLYNTLTNSPEELQLIEPGHLRFYSCGPTVYSYAHIGNFRSFLTADLIFRLGQAVGLDVTYVTNVTDVGHLTEDDAADAGGEDRMAKALKSKEGERFANVWDLARYYTESLLGDWRRLNLLEPTVRPRATEHMREQITAVSVLLERGHAYETEQGIYFSVASFPEYGKLSGNLNADALDQEVREVVSDPGKRDPRDFALWKKDEKHLMQWHSPWGWGFPGWHIECSVMASAYLGETIDLHAGGEDLIFPHHECEIAQAEALSGEPFARHWVHTRFLQVEGEKMSKSKGNFLTVRRLTAPRDDDGWGVDPLALRLALMSGHYRKPFNFTKATLKASGKHRERIASAIELLRTADGDGPDRIGERLDALYDRMLAALCDDLNTPEAIAALIEGVKLIHGMSRGLNAESARSGLAWFDRVNALLGVIEPDTDEPASDADDPHVARIDGLLAERQQARADRDFARADAIRDELAAEGIEIMDTPEGPRWKRRQDL